MTETETSDRDFSTSEAVEVERARLLALLDAGEIRSDEYLRRIMAAVREWKIANYPKRRWKKMKTTAPELPWAERRLSELPGVIDELRSQLADADRRRTKLLEDSQLERDGIAARLNAALAELAALKTQK